MDSNVWSNEFPITSVTRDDLVAAGFKKEVVETLTDEDMQQIASAMEDVYCDHGYWEDLEICTNRTLERKKEDGEIQGDDEPDDPYGTFTVHIV